MEENKNKSENCEETDCDSEEERNAWHLFHEEEESDSDCSMPCSLSDKEEDEEE